MANVVDPNIEQCIENNEDSDDSEEDIEPKLTYERISNDITVILKTDFATAIAVHSKFIALGTKSGKIHILDHQGNRVHHENELYLHSKKVNDISIDEKGEYLATCSDNRIVICGLYTNENNYKTLSNDLPIRTISIDPYFSKLGSGRKFIVNEGDKIVLYEKSFLSRYKGVTLQQGRGQIRIIRWRAQFIAWASDTCIKIYDMEERIVITVIEREKDHDFRLRPELFLCCFCWKNDRTLLVGWADSVKICCIRQRTFDRPQNDVSAKSLPQRYVELTSSFNVEYGICGIAPIESNLILLCVNKETRLNDLIDANIGRPQLQVIETIGTDGYAEISSDILSPKQFKDNKNSEYCIECLPEEGLYFIMCPKDMIFAKPREEDDHISWLLNHGSYQEALELVKNNKNLKKHSLISVGNQYMKYLLDQNHHSQYEKAAQLCSFIYGTNKDGWEQAIMRFKEINQLRVVASYLPRGPELILDPAVYEMVLQDFLLHDSKGFLKTIREWPLKIYSTAAIVNATLDRLTTDPKNDNLLEALAELYSRDGKYDKALTIYLEIGNKKQVFDLIRHYGLHSTLQDKLELFMQLNAEETSRLLIENLETIPVESIVKKLKSKSKLLFIYLNGLVQKDPELCSSHHALLVELYAQFSPDKLLGFLRSSNYYQLEKALDICWRRNLFNEIVFLLGRMGNTKEALQLITDKLNDIDYAIEFCKEHSDSELWEDLIKYSMNKPCFIRVLLQNIGTHMADPIVLIRRIPEGMKIDGLMQALVRILQDYNLQSSLEEGCRRVLVTDCYNLLEKLNKQHKRGLPIYDDCLCHCCQRKIYAREIRHANDVVIFNCRHIFHETCLSDATGEYVCIICIAAKKNDFRS